MQDTINFGTYLDNIYYLDNLSTRTHGLNNIKIQIHQPGKHYPHDVSVKVFDVKKRDYWIIRIDRNTGEITEKVQPVDEFPKKDKKDILLFIANNYKNFIEMWNDEDKASDEVDWIK